MSPSECLAHSVQLVRIQRHDFTLPVSLSSKVVNVQDGLSFFTPLHSPLFLPLPPPTAPPSAFTPVPPSVPGVYIQRDHCIDFGIVKKGDAERRMPLSLINTFGWDMTVAVSLSVC